MTFTKVTKPMDRNFSLTLRNIPGEGFEVDVLESETGYGITIPLPFLDEHCEFDSVLGAEIVSWAEIMVDEAEDEEEEE